MRVFIVLGILLTSLTVTLVVFAFTDRQPPLELRLAHALSTTLAGVSGMYFRREAAQRRHVRPVKFTRFDVGYGSTWYLVYGGLLFGVGCFLTLSLAA